MEAIAKNKHNLMVFLIWHSSLTNQVTCIFFVLGTDIFSDVVTGIELRSSRDFSGLGISSRIVDGELDFQMSQIGPPKALDHVHLFGVRMARGIQPGSVVEAHSVDHQR